MNESTTCCSARTNGPRDGLWISSALERAFWIILAVASMSSGTCSVHEGGDLRQISSNMRLSRAVRYS